MNKQIVVDRNEPGAFIKEHLTPRKPFAILFFLLLFTCVSLIPLGATALGKFHYNVVAAGIFKGLAFSFILLQPIKELLRTGVFVLNGHRKFRWAFGQTTSPFWIIPVGLNLNKALALRSVLLPISVVLVGTCIGLTFVSGENYVVGNSALIFWLCTCSLDFAVIEALRPFQEVEFSECNDSGNLHLSVPEASQV